MSVAVSSNAGVMIVSFGSFSLIVVVAISSLPLYTLVPSYSATIVTSPVANASRVIVNVPSSSVVTSNVSTKSPLV